MATSAQNSRRPVAVSSMSSLDSSASTNDAARDKTTLLNVVDHGQMQAADANVVSSSTLNSVVASPTHLGSTASDKDTNAMIASSATTPTGMLLSAPVPAFAMSTPAVSAAALAPVAPNNNTVAEFLFQLSKMLTDDNKEIIEWSNGKQYISV